MFRWGIVALAVFFLILVFPTRFARPVYLATMWISLAVGKAESRNDNEADVAEAMRSRKEPFVPSGYVSRGGSRDLQWSESSEAQSPAFDFPADPKADRGKAGEIHWSEDASTGDDKG